MSTPTLRAARKRVTALINELESQGLRVTLDVKIEEDPAQVARALDEGAGLPPDERTMAAVVLARAVADAGSFRFDAATGALGFDDVPADQHHGLVWAVGLLRPRIGAAMAREQERVDALAEERLDALAEADREGARARRRAASTGEWL